MIEDPLLAKVIVGLIVATPAIIVAYLSSIRGKKREQLQSAEALLPPAHSRLSDAITRLHNDPLSEPYTLEVRRYREAYLNQFNQVCTMIVAAKRLHHDALERLSPKVVDWISGYPEYFKQGTPFPAILKMIPCALSLGIDPYKNPYVTTLSKP